MDWINCNSCFIQPGNGKTFHLTSCGHIYCGDCIIPRTANCCYICNKNCTSFQLTNQMHSEISIYFSDLADALEESSKEIMSYLQKKFMVNQRIYCFQLQHKSLLMRHFASYVTKYNDLLAEVKIKDEKIKQLDERVRQMDEELKYLKNKAAQSSNNTHPILKSFDFHIETPKSVNNNLNSFAFRTNFDRFNKTNDLNKQDKPTSRLSTISQLFNQTQRNDTKLSTTMPNDQPFLTPKVNNIYSKEVTSGQLSIKDLFLSSSQHKGHR